MGRGNTLKQLLAALIAGGNWNNGAQDGARAVNCNNYPWNVNTNNGVRGARDLNKGILGAGPYGALARIIKAKPLAYSQR